MWETDFGGPGFNVFIIVVLLVFLSIPVVIGVAVGGLAGMIMQGGGFGYGTLMGFVFGAVSIPLNLLLTLSYFNADSDPFMLWVIAIPVSALLVIVAPIAAVKRRAAARGLLRESGTPAT
ncbi:hypothetical protein GBAR_LOCUS10458 [Geodia barretti]|uniref:Uncharacterized protein n=1 Tax=Geodia barretti TaxID=519541 RepID=A0AA35RV79_GEOBA|nr:hypothetical protein GBAR_LOCUS10458 [Geodia barretti]